MSRSAPVDLVSLDEQVALRTILEGTATATGEKFFTALVENLARALDTHAALVTEYLPTTRRARAIAFQAGGEWIEGFEYDVEGTPCGKVLEGAQFLHYASDVQTRFPGDKDLVELGAISYMGVPLYDVDGCVLGHLAVLDRRPMPEEPRGLALFRIFADRAAAELQRLRAETAVRDREEKLARLVDSAMDAILELDHAGTVTRLNAAAEKVFGCPADDIVGGELARFIVAQDRDRLQALCRELDGRPPGQSQLWIAGGLTALRHDGTQFAAEATLSRFEMKRAVFYTVILRDVHARLEAEQTIRSLTAEAESLREELREVRGFGEIVGRSEALRRVLREIDEVAPTHATVLVQGETGTGKELVARAVHAASIRRDGPFVTVNCAAIVPSLIESELFGHEKGAFTGASRRRDGRFALADGGTVFLDEVGEIPLDLQAKLLRVLQEGTFEPVGSSTTRRVDVRVVAATNRDLRRAIERGEFREDLYYRLNVFPIVLPPLRERGDDITVLASAFVERAARRLGRRVDPLSDGEVNRLRAYAWPGNVRELENVIERAVITASGGRLGLDRALPDDARSSSASRAQPEAAPGSVRTAREIEQLERENLVRALEATGWQVAGEQGAAALLGVKPSTLSSRLKALGIQRPR